MKIALVHDYLIEAGGAERVLEVLSDMYPSAPIYVSLAKCGSAKAMFGDCKIVESKWAWFLKIGRFYSYFRFLLPLIWKSIDLTEYDIVLTSCSGYIARGFRVRKDAKVIAYCHTPPRWLYGYDTPTGAQNTWWGRMFMWIVGPFVRYFDYQSAQRVDKWIANSKEVAGRIFKFYRKKATVVYPPIEIDPSTTVGMTRRGDYYLMISRIVGGKGIEEVIEAFAGSKTKLKIAGEIVSNYTIKSLDHYTNKSLNHLEYSNIEYLGRVDDSTLAELYSGAIAFVALARDEDFGMTVVESMAYGTPILAYNGGGYKETVIPGKTGILIDGTDVQSIKDGLAQIEKTKWNRAAIKAWASKFNRARFEREIRGIVNA